MRDRAKKESTRQTECSEDGRRAKGVRGDREDRAIRSEKEQTPKKGRPSRKSVREKGEGRLVCLPDLHSEERRFSTQARGTGQIGEEEEEEERKMINDRKRGVLEVVVKAGNGGGMRALMRLGGDG